MAGSWVMPILERAWAACLMPLFVPSRAKGRSAFEPPCEKEYQYQILPELN